MKWISTTIMKKYFLEIKNGIKTREYKEHTEHWIKRLEPLIEYMKEGGEVGSNFLCGKDYHKRKVLYIQYINVTWSYKVVDKDLSELYIIYLGNEIEEE